MREFLRCLLVSVCAAIGLVLGFNLVVVDIPVYRHDVFLDYGDPDRPGHMKGVLVSTPELILKVAIVVASISLAAYILNHQRKEGKFTKSSPSN